MNARSSAWRRADSYVVNRFVPSRCVDPAVEVGDPESRAVRARLARDPIEQKVGPQRRPDEVDVVDDDGVGIEQRNAVPAMKSLRGWS